MYSITKIHYTPITMNKEGAASFVKKKDQFLSYLILESVCQTKSSQSVLIAPTSGHI